MRVSRGAIYSQIGKCGVGGGETVVAGLANRAVVTYFLECQLQLYISVSVIHRWAFPLPG